MKRSSVLAAIIGNILEWYDFSLFIYVAPILAILYFPADHPALNLLYTLLLFALGFLVRPLGALWFGYLGDRYGRAAALKLTLYGITVPALLIAVIPTYQQIGWWAPVLLALCRIVQGIAISGEVVGTIIYLAESAAGHRRAWLSSLANNGANVGVLLATGTASLLAHAAPSFTSTSWRFAFLAGGLLGLIGIRLRNTLQESAVYLRLQQSQTSLVMPLRTLLRERRQPLLKLCGLLVMTAVGNYVLLGYMSTYLSAYLHYPLAHALTIQTLLVLISLLFVPVAAHLSDRYGRRRCLLIAALGYALCAWPCFKLLTLGASWLWLIPLIMCYCLEQGTTPATLVELFPAAARYTAISFGYNLTFALVGGTTPAFNTWLIQHTQNPLMIAGTLSISAILAAIVIIFGLPRTFGQQHSLIPVTKNT